MAKPRVVVVLGMHRSGTSMLARMIARFGVRLGGRLLTDPAADNKYGYWEHRDIAMTQDFLLARLGRMWHEPRGVLPLPEEWMQTDAAREARRSLTDLVRGELADGAGEAFGFKDPRTLRFLPLWRAIFAELGVNPVYILALRRPDSVAASLAGRNRLSLQHSRYLWVQHTLAPFRAPALRIACCIDYDLWFDRPAVNLRRLALATGARLTGAQARALGEELLDRNENHHPGGQQACLAGEIHALLTGRLPAAWRLRRMVREFDATERRLIAWQELIEQCHPAGPLPVAAWE